MSLKVANSSSTPSIPLDWRQRRDSLKKNIADDFAEQQKKDCSSVPESMEDKQLLCGINEFALLKKTILQAYPAQKEFNALNNGARDFRWSWALADFICFVLIHSGISAKAWQRKKNK